MHVHSAYECALLIISNLSITIIMNYHSIILLLLNVTYISINLGNAEAAAVLVGAVAAWANWA